MAPSPAPRRASNHSAAAEGALGGAPLPSRRPWCAQGTQNPERRWNARGSSPVTTSGQLATHLVDHVLGQVDECLGIH